MSLRTVSQPYKDGVVKIYEVTDIAPAGNKPDPKLTEKSKLRYDQRIVGMQRYWIAKQAQSEIEMVIRVPRILSIGTDDIAVPNDGKQYKIAQIQYPPDIYPLSMDLSLERLEADYDIS